MDSNLIIMKKLEDNWETWRKIALTMLSIDIIGMQFIAFDVNNKEIKESILSKYFKIID